MAVRKTVSVATWFVFLMLLAANSQAVPITCEAVGKLWKPLGVYVDQNLGLKYRAEIRDYVCSVAGKQGIRVSDQREVFLGLPTGIVLLRYPGTTVLFVGGKADGNALAFAASLVQKGGVDLLMIHEGVQLDSSVARRASLVLWIKPGEHALAIKRESFPLYRLAQILDDYDLGLMKPKGR